MHGLKEEIEAKVKSAAGSAIFRLRKPTNKELLGHMEMILFLQHHNKFKSLITERCSFFDSLLVSVLELSGFDGNPIPIETNDHIPLNWKTYVICKCFEDAEVMRRGSTDASQDKKTYGIFTPRRLGNQMKRRPFMPSLYVGRIENEGT